MNENLTNKAVTAFSDIFKHSAYTYFGKIVDNLRKGGE